MDPNACLARFLDACRAGDRDEALHTLGTLRVWIATGGFLPADPRPAPHGPDPEHELAPQIAGVVTIMASGRAPGDPILTGLDHWIEALQEAGQPPLEHREVLAALPATVAILRKTFPEAAAHFEERAARIIWTGL